MLTIQSVSLALHFQPIDLTPLKSRLSFASITTGIIHYHTSIHSFLWNIYQKEGTSLFLHPCLHSHPVSICLAANLLSIRRKARRDAKRVISPLVALCGSYKRAGSGAGRGPGGEGDAKRRVSGATRSLSPERPNGMSRLRKLRVAALVAAARSIESWLIQARARNTVR